MKATGIQERNPPKFIMSGQLSYYGYVINLAAMMEFWVQFDAKCYSSTVAFAASLQHSQQDRLGCPFLYLPF